MFTNHLSRIIKWNVFKLVFLDTRTIIINFIVYNVNSVARNIYFFHVIEKHGLLITISNKQYAL